MSSAKLCCMAMTSPILSFGVIADVQYADIDDGHNYSRTKIRYYRNALNLLAEALENWKKHGTEVKFILQLGDLIDGYNRSKGPGSEAALTSVMRVLDQFNGSVFHVWGNHEFYNFSRKYLLESRLFSGRQPSCSGVPNKAYYTLRPLPKLIIVSLDCYDISPLGYEKSDPLYPNAMSVLEKNNPNVDKNDPRGLIGAEIRFCMFNGAVGAEQLEWLDSTLNQAQQDGINVIVMGHVPVYEPSSDWLDMLWNYEEVLAVLGAYTGCVLCYLAGHQHVGGYARDDKGLLHITMPGVIEVTPGSNAYSTVDVYQDKLCIHGEGRASSFTLPLKFNLNDH